MKGAGQGCEPRQGPSLPPGHNGASARGPRSRRPRPGPTRPRPSATEAGPSLAAWLGASRRRGSSAGTQARARAGPPSFPQHRRARLVRGLRGPGRPLPHSPVAHHHTLDRLHLPAMAAPRLRRSDRPRGGAGPSRAEPSGAEPCTGGRARVSRRPRPAAFRGPDAAPPRALGQRSGGPAPRKRQRVLLGAGLPHWGPPAQGQSFKTWLRCSCTAHRRLPRAAEEQRWEKQKSFRKMAFGFPQLPKVPCQKQRCPQQWPCLKTGFAFPLTCGSAALPSRHRQTSYCHRLSLL